MRRPLIYLAIFALFFWTMWASFAYLISPTDSHGHWRIDFIVVFLALLFCATTTLISLIIASIKAKSPNRKLPHLLIRDSLIQSAITALGIIGLLVLQLLRVATVINIILWLILFIGIEWTLQQTRKIHREKVLGRGEEEQINR